MIADIMDSSTSLYGSRGSRPSYPRASSRSSTSTVNTRATSQSTNSFTSVSTSPQLSQSHPSHRFHHAHCAKPSGSPRATPRHTPQLSREGSIESTRQIAVSALLQERLSKERKMEGERSGHGGLARQNFDMSSSLELGRSTLDSPVRLGETDSPRPRSSAGASANAEPAKKPGLGVMEMEHVISKLHKQNFDLKLELYHRREKQTTIERQMEELESDKRELEQINDNLLEELDKRDKAVEEAVAMIVTLEARVEQLISERETVRQLDRESFFYAEDFNSINDEIAEPDIRVQEPSSSSGEQEKVKAKAINRVPSFLSEKTENTETLRKVYLGVMGSALSLQKVTEGTPEPDNGPSNGLGSPTLSVLSESSFVSVYGRKSDHGEDGFPPPIDDPLSLDGVELHQYSNPVLHNLPVISEGKLGSLPARAASANALTRGSGYSPISSCSVFTNHHGYQNQPFERPSKPMSERKRGPPPPPLHIIPARKIVREETGEDAKQVMIEAPGGVRLHEQGLPPTPSSISESALDTRRVSSDSFTHQLTIKRNDGQAITNQESPQKGKSRHHDGSGVSLVEKPRPERLQGATARTSKKVSSHGRHGVMLQNTRSRSNSEVTRRGVYAEDDRVDSDDDSDTRSLRSSMDIWMRESIKPDGAGSSQASPDLFGFPTGSSRSGWGSQAQLGAAAQGIGLDAAYLHHLTSLRQVLFAANVAPAPPDRRSSLHAQTASTSGSPRVSQNNSVAESDQKTRHARGHSDSQAHTPVQRLAQPTPPPGEKRNHYPPIVGQQSGGARAGLNRLFRRSTGSGSMLSSSNGAQEGIPHSASEMLPDASRLIPRNTGTPSWLNKTLATEDEDDRSGATPPPILLKPVQVRRNTVGVEMAPDYLQQQMIAKEFGLTLGDSGRQTPSSQKQLATPSTPSGTGIRRKWLPTFARTGSIKNRTG